MPLIPNEWAIYYYVANLIVAGMILSVILIDRATMRMSTPHAGFFYVIAAGLFLEGVFGMVGSDDETLYRIAFLCRLSGVYALGISIFFRTVMDRLPKKYQAR